MKVIGLTGGIGAGKSTVSEYLRKQGYVIIDADAIAHQITEKGTETLKKLVQCFGENILFADGSLNRKKLAAIVFQDSAMKAQLERLTTDEVVRIIKNQVDALRKEEKYGIIFVDAPLLFETGADRLTDLVWLVTADLEVRVARVMDRDQVTRDEVLHRIQNQMDSDAKAKLSQEVIDNSKGKEELYHQIEYLLMRYVK